MSWYKTLGEYGDIVLSTRVRLARNLEDYPFPVRLDREGKRQVCECVRQALEAFSEEKLSFIDMEELSRGDAVSLAEKHLISPEFAYDATGRALLQSEDEEVNLMLCEEDHIRIQVILPGLSQKEAFQRAERIDRAIEKKLNYAFNERLGYLTQCPTNLGTGMRASVMLHLPALVRKGAMRRLSSTVSKLGLTLRGAYSEGVEAAGDVFLLSNQVTLGISEEAALQNLGSIALQIITEEKQARAAVIGDSEFIDLIYRSKGILQSAYKLSSKELVSLTSLVLLGASEKLIDVPTETLASMNILLMPATLKKAEGESLSRDERDIIRAKRIREALAEN